MSESPKEESPTGVLGRIGSWFSPWRTQNPRDLETENAVPAIEQPPGPDSDAGEGGEEGAEPVREPYASWQREEGTRTPSFNPERSRLSRDTFSSEKEATAAAQSAHRGSPFVSTDWEPAERGEEFLDAREFQEGRRGPAWEREASNSSPVAGDPTSEKNASHLTRLPHARVQGVEGKAGTLHSPVLRKAHAQAGKELHVYLEEETSVLNSGSDAGTGQGVVRTRLKKSFHVLAKAKSLEDLDSQNGGQEQPEISSSPGSTQNRFSAPVELEFTPPSDTQGGKPEPEPEGAESTRMGRKHNSRRKSRKQSQGDAESDSQENTPSKGQDIPGSPSTSGRTLTGAQAPGVETHLGEAAGNSASAQSLSVGGKNKTSPTAIQKEIPPGQQSKGYQGTDWTSPTGTFGAAVDGEADMEDEYKLERKTETPESKRRSIKVSRSEVKIFPKKVELQSGPGSGNASQKFYSGLSKPQDAAKDHSKTEVFTGKRHLGKLDEEPKPVVAGRIADKISLFEGQRAGAVKKTFQTPRSADVSPARAATRQLKADVGDIRSKSADRLDDVRSSSAPPVREKAKTVKERARNIEACKAECKTPVSPKIAMTGMSLKTSPSVTLRATPKPSQLGIQDKLAVNDKSQTANILDTRSKHDVPDGIIEAVTISGPEQLQTDSRTKHSKEPTEVKDLLTTPDIVAPDRPGPSDSGEHANEINPQAKTPSRTCPRSKKKKSREPASPTNGMKPDGSNESPLTSSKQEKASAIVEPASPTLLLTDTVKVQSDKSQSDKSLGNTSVDENHSVTDSPQQVSGQTVECSYREPGPNDDSRYLSSKGKGGLSISVTEKEGPDTAISHHRTKQPIDPRSLAGKEEKPAGQDPISDQKGEDVSKDPSRAIPSPTALLVEQPLIEKPPPVEQSAPDACVKSETPPRQPESKAKGSVKQQLAKTETINQSEDECTEKNTHCTMKNTRIAPQAQDQVKDKMQEKQQQQNKQPMTVDNITTKGMALNSRADTTDREDSKAEAGIKGKDKLATLNSEPKQSEVMKKASPAKQTVETPARVTEVQTAQGAASQHSNEIAASVVTHTVCVSDSDKGPVKSAKLQRTTNESKTNTAKVPSKETKAAVTAVELQSECLSVGKTEPLTDDSHTRGAGGDVAQEVFVYNLLVKTGAAVKPAPEESKPLPNGKSDGRGDPIYPDIILPKPISQDVADKPINNNNSNSFLTTGVKSSQKITADPPHPTQFNDSQKPQQTANTVDSAAATQEVVQSSCDIEVIVPSIRSTMETETLDKQNIQRSDTSPVVNGDIHPKPQPVNKPGPALCAPDTAKASPRKENTEGVLGSPQRSPQRSPQTRLALSRGLSGGDLSLQRDAPSSWLDVDVPKQRLRTPEQPPRLCLSSSESNLLDTVGELGDDDFVEKIKNLCAPFSMPQRKHSYLRPPQPPFAMPAIREDRFEKTFDPDDFKFGLRKKPQKSGPSLLAKLQSTETKANLKPARASLVDRSMLLTSLDTRSRLRERTSAHEEKGEGKGETSTTTTTVNEKEEKKEEVKVRSRLEGSSILSSLCASSARGKRAGLDIFSLSGGVSSSDAPQSSPPPGGVSSSDAPQSSPSPGGVSSSDAPQSSPPPGGVSSSDAPQASPPPGGVSSSDAPQSSPPPGGVSSSDAPQSSPPPGGVSSSNAPQSSPPPGGVSSSDAPQSSPPPGGVSSRNAPQASPPPGGVSSRNAPQSSPPPGGVSSSDAPQSSPPPGGVSSSNAPQSSPPPGGVSSSDAPQSSPPPGGVSSSDAPQSSPPPGGVSSRNAPQASPPPGGVSSSNAPQASPPLGGCPPDPTSPPSPGPLAETSVSHGPEALAGSGNTDAVVSESTPPLPSFNDIKLPDYLEKYLPREPEKSERSKAGKEQVNTEKPRVMTSPVALDVATAMDKKPGDVVAGETPPCLPATPAVPPSKPTKLTPLPLLRPQRMNTAEIIPKGPHRRPGKMVLFENPLFGGQAYEVFRDLEDATTLQLSPVISVRVVRGCWILYESPGFQGRSIALEEGCLELTNVWASTEPGTDPHGDPDMIIGSIRLAVCDYVLPYIDLFTELKGHGHVTAYHDDTVETGSFGISQSTASLKVHSGVWLVFSDPGYQGMLAVLEPGEYPFPESWGFPSPFIGSLRPLKMGAFKVENPNEVKAVLYESPGFQGPCLEVHSDVFCFDEEGEQEQEEEKGEDKTLNSTKLKSVGSLKIIGGLWVGYSQPGFEGQQHVLEEGEYLDRSDWGGGSECLLSLRPVLADFISPHLKMFTDKDFGTLGANIDLTVPVPSMEHTGYGLRTQSVDILGGVWVVFEQPDFCGETYVLEKGLYGSPEDWGAAKPTVASVMPVMLDMENSAKFKVHLFSEEDFQGSEVVLEDSAEALEPGFSVSSCRVLAGSWLAFEGAGFSSRMYVLEVGSYADLRALGCVAPNASILSLQITGFEFSLPSVTLFERSALRGKRVALTAGAVNLQLAGCSRLQSLLVEGGMWILYEEINYRGNQILLKPGEIPDWYGYSSWQKIGSLRPIIQKQAYIRLRNRETGLLMSVTGELEDIKLMRVQEMEESGGVEQIWLYQDGHLHCKLLEECCLCPSGTVTMAGSRLGLSPEPAGQLHLWSITPDGRVTHASPARLLLDIKGGLNYDKNQVILNTYDPNKPTQHWDVEIL